MGACKYQIASICCTIEPSAINVVCYSDQVEEVGKCETFSIPCIIGALNPRAGFVSHIDVMNTLICICYKKMINVTEFKKLKNNYDTRNDCGHPTSIKLSPNEIVVIFENTYGLLLHNGKL